MCEVVEQVLQGTDPVVMEPGLLTPLPRPGWKARIRSLQVDGARADYVEYDPYRFEVPGFEDRPEAPLRMMLVVILAGTSVGSIDGRPITLGAKQAALIDGHASMSFRASGPIRAVRLFVDEDHLPATTLLPRPAPVALLKDSPLVAGVAGLIMGLLQVGNPTVRQHDASATSQPLIALQASLLDEALHQDPFDDRDDDVAPRRALIEAYIEEHLGERGLNVATIASALGVTVRTVHAAYEGSGATVAGTIRGRRMATAQTLLALRREPPNVAALAERVGLTRDQLTRVFRSATGSTVPEWWSANRAGEPARPARPVRRGG